jgi:fatty acid desaturase
MVTVVLSVVLLIIGLAFFFYQAQAVDFVRGLSFLPNDLSRQIVSVMTERVAAWVALAGSPILLIIGSLLPNI